MLGGADNPNGELPSYITVVAATAHIAEKSEQLRIFHTSVST